MRRRARAGWCQHITNEPLLSHLGKGELTMGNELDGGLVHIPRAIEIFRVYFFECSVLHPD